MSGMLRSVGVALVRGILANSRHMQNWKRTEGNTNIHDIEQYQNNTLYALELKLS